MLQLIGMVEGANIDPVASLDHLNPVAMGFSHNDRPTAIASLDESGVAVIRVEGMLHNHRSYWLPSWPVLIEDLNYLEGNAAVTSVVFDIDSPGGIVMGSLGLFDRMDKFSKPLIAYGRGWMASMAYQMACHCDQVVCSPDAEVGGCGIRFTVYDDTRQLVESGVDQYEFVTGEFKAIIDSKMTPAHQDHLQKWVERLGLNFRSALGLRGLNAQQVESVFDGRWWGPDDALSLGLVSAVTDLGSVVTALSSNPTAQISSEGSTMIRRQRLNLAARGGGNSAASPQSVQSFSAVAGGQAAQPGDVQPPAAPAGTPAQPAGTVQPPAAPETPADPPAAPAPAGTVQPPAAPAPSAPAPAGTVQPPAAPASAAPAPAGTVQPPAAPALSLIHI